MATDGVKIIDGDLAYDVYNKFIDMFDNGATLETLNEEYTEDKKDFASDEEDYEICITVYALAFWEIGKLTVEILKDVDEVIAQKATVKGWALEVGDKQSKKRQKELDKFREKISIPKVKPRKSKNYKKITDFLLKQGDILVFQSADETYSLTVVIDISEEKGKCYYTFCRTTNKLDYIPENIENIDFIGFRYGINLTPSLWGLELEHVKLKKYLDKFQHIGNVNIKGERSYCCVSDYDEFCVKFPLSEQETTNCNYMGRRIYKFNVKDLLNR